MIYLMYLCINSGAMTNLFLFGCLRKNMD